MRWPLISIVSPSITLARPTIGAGSRAKATVVKAAVMAKAARRIIGRVYAARVAEDDCSPRSRWSQIRHKDLLIIQA